MARSQGDIFRYFLKQLLPKCAKDFGLTVDVVDPLKKSPQSDVITDELVENFRKALWFTSSVCLSILGAFLKEYLSDIQRSNHAYASTVLYICKVVNDQTADVHHRFLSVVTAVVTTAKFFVREGVSKYLRYTAPILITFFEKRMRHTFYQSGGWTSLSSYIARQSCLGWYPVGQTPPLLEFSGRFRQEIQELVDASGYRNAFVNVIPDKVKSDSLCEQLAKEVVGYFPDQSENPEGARLCHPSSMKTSSQQVPMAMGESGRPIQASAPTGARSADSPKFDFSAFKENMLRSLDICDQRVARIKLSDSATAFMDHSALSFSQSSDFYNLKVLLIRMGIETARLSDVFQTLIPK